MASGADTHTHIQTEVILRNQAQEGWHAPGLITAGVNKLSHMFTSGYFMT